MIPLMGFSVDVGSVTYASRPCKVVTVPLGVASSCTWPLKQSGQDMMICLCDLIAEGIRSIMVFPYKTGIVLSETMAKINLPKKISFGKSGGTDAYVVCCQLMWAG